MASVTYSGPSPTAVSHSLHLVDRDATAIEPGSHWIGAREQEQVGDRVLFLGSGASVARPHAWRPWSGVLRSSTTSVSPGTAMFGEPAIRSNYGLCNNTAGQLNRSEMDAEASEAGATKRNRFASGVAAYGDAPIIPPVSIVV
jgi:hypothetical protein